MSISFDIHDSNFTFQLLNLCSFLLKVYLMTFCDNFKLLPEFGFHLFFYNLYTHFACMQLVLESLNLLRLLLDLDKLLLRRSFKGFYPFHMHLIVFAELVAALLKCRRSCIYKVLPASIVNHIGGVHLLSSQQLSRLS